MTTYNLQKELAERIIAKKIAITVYIMVYLIEKENQLFPAYPQGDGFEYVGVDDTKGHYAYIRENGNIDFQVKTMVGCGDFLYKVTSPMRVVFYGGQGQRDIFISIMLQVFKGLDITVRRVITDKNELFRDEQKGREFFSNEINYFGIDFDYVQMLTSRECELVPDFCKETQYKFC